MGIYELKLVDLLSHQMPMSKAVIMGISLIVILQFGKTNGQRGCGLLSNPSNGDVSYNSLGLPNLGTVAIYNCDLEYTLSGSKFRLCQFGGTWSNSRPQCIRTNCSSLSVPKNGSVSYNSSSLYVWTLATYSCDSGYALSGPSNLTCISGGYWSGLSQYCIRMFCFTLSNPINGSISYDSSSLTVGTIATYNCNTGYTLRGDSTRTCLSGGLWSSNTAFRYCSRSTCFELSSPSNGRVSYNSSSLSVGTTATYSCNSGYTLSGSSTRTCQSGRSWSGSRPYCQGSGSTSGTVTVIGIVVGVTLVSGFIGLVYVCITVIVLVSLVKSKSQSPPIRLLQTQSSPMTTRTVMNGTQINDRQNLISQNVPSTDIPLNTYPMKIELQEQLPADYSAIDDSEYKTATIPPPAI